MLQFLIIKTDSSNVYGENIFLLIYKGSSSDFCGDIVPLDKMALFHYGDGIHKEGGPPISHYLDDLMYPSTDLVEISPSWDYGHSVNKIRFDLFDEVVLRIEKPYIPLKEEIVANTIKNFINGDEVILTSTVDFRIDSFNITFQNGVQEKKKNGRLTYVAGSSPIVEEFLKEYLNIIYKYM